MRSKNPTKAIQTSTLKVAILAEVNHESPITGYTLTKSIPDSANWHSSHQQIYRDCRDLSAKGLLSVKSQPNDGKPDSRLYSITSDGRKALKDIRKMSVFIPPTFKNPLTVMLLAGSSSYFESAIEERKETVSRLTEALLALTDRPKCEVKRLSIELELDIAETELKFANRAKKILCV